MSTTNRKTILILLSLLLLLSSIYLFPNPAIAQENVVSSFASPGTDPHGLAWDGQYLWNADNDDDKIYKLNPSTLAVVGSISSPDRNPQGLTWDGDYLWCADAANDKIYKLDSSTGTIVDSFSSPGTDPQGLTWDGDYLWNADNDDDKIYKLNPSTGAIVDSFASPGSNVYGLAWDGDYLWHDDSTDDKIYKLNPSTGAIVDSISSPGRQPRGLAWDGDYLWHCDSTDDKIYKLDVVLPPVEVFSVSASPSSRTVVRGRSTNFTISVEWTSGTPETVTLSVSDVPDGCSSAFSPISGTPDFTSTLTIATSVTAILGSHILTITGKSSSEETVITSVTLEIREYEPSTMETVSDLIKTPSVLAAVIGFIGTVITAIVAIAKLRGRRKRGPD